jgi:aminoglycoside 3-N-acetyltransferase
MAVIDRERIASELRKLGLREGDAVMMHSSLSALGHVEGGAEMVVDALLDAIGSSGTLVVPAFRDSVWGDMADFTISDCCPCSQRLCPSRQPGFQGIIPNTVLKRKGVLRSCHPTHSWAALGPDAEQLLSGHRDTPAMCGRHNPFEKLVELDGCILTLGVGVNTVTLWHYYEEILQAPYLGHFWPEERHLNNCVGGRRIQYDHPGIMQEVCKASGILEIGQVGKSVSGVMRAREFDSFMATIMADDPYCMVLRPTGRERCDLANDALLKADKMLKAWSRGATRPKECFDVPLRSVQAAAEGDLVREDCPAFAGYHNADGKSIPLCFANGRHPDYFRLGGPFDKCGLTTCGLCSWNIKFSIETKGKTG